MVHGHGHEVIAICEVGYVPLADRAETAALIPTTNLPFSEWTQVIPNARLRTALPDTHYRSGVHSRRGHRVISVPSSPLVTHKAERITAPTKSRWTLPKVWT